MGVRWPPLLLVDVDGVLSLYGTGDAPALIDGVPHSLSRAAAGVLNELAPHFECVWCTGWEERADEHLPHLLGLPRGWPHLTFEKARGPGTSGPGHWKLQSINALAGEHRPLAWIDDAHDAACHAWAAERPGATFLVPTNPAVGLTRAHARELLDWRAGVG